VNPASQSAHARNRDRQLTRQQFDLLLSHLSINPAEGGDRYEMLRGRLIFFFSHCMLPLPEDLADEVLNRLARKLEAYALGIARHVLQEQRANSDRERGANEEFHRNVSREMPTIDEEEEIRLEHMKKCLDRLPLSDRVMLSEYYLADGSVKISVRKRLAMTKGMTQATLRKRVFALRRLVQRCMQRQRIQ